MDKYEEALERAREIYNAPVATIVTRTFLEQIFPELKESEDERIRKNIVALVEQSTEILSPRNKQGMLSYLEKQKEQESVEYPEKDNRYWFGFNEGKGIVLDNPEEYGLCKPAGWSEEDETCLEYALWCVTKTRLFAAKDVCDLDACQCAERWLKALRDRFALSHWKPSEEQMKALWEVEDRMRTNKAFTLSNRLTSLYNDLKKL